MPQPNSRRVITRDRYDAVLLDLDGVITDTANLHAACVELAHVARGMEQQRPRNTPRY